MKALREIRKSKKGFTLIEIMIVVLIIGILLAIAVPNFMKARETSRSKSCITNLKQIQAAKEQWAMDTNAAVLAEPAWADIKGPDSYIKHADAAALACPGGGEYAIGTMSANPTCTRALDGHVLP